MSEKRFNSRVIHKHDIESNWAKSSFVPLKGELVIFDTDESHLYERIKVGDGIQTVNALPFVNDAVRTELLAQISTTNTTISNVSELVGDTAVSEQISTAVSAKADLEAGTYVVSATTEDGVAYAATVPNITALTAGINFIMVPAAASTTKGPTLNVNGLGDKYIRRRLSSGATVTEGYTTTWITKNKPFRVMYDGTQWVVEGHNKPVSADIYGPITATNDADGNNIVDTYATKTELQNILPKVTTVSLLAASWTGDAVPYSQVVTVSGATANSKVDLQPSAAQVVELQDADIAFMTENTDGVVTVYALGSKPTSDYTMQALIQEVITV